MKKQYLQKFLYPVIFTLTSHTAFAASPAPQTTLLDEVVVTTSRTSENKKSVSANISTITSEDIRQSTSRNVGDLLAEEGSVYIHKYPGNLISVGIRGFRTDTHGNDLQSHVLVLLDGRRAGTGNLAKILTKNVERIEIIRGPGAVQYGSAGMGGVINIITRTGTNNSFFVEGGAGSYGEVEGSLGGTANENGFDFSGTYSYQTRDDYDTGNGDTYSNTGVNYDTGISANLGYSFSDTNRLGVIFTGFSTDEAGNPGSLQQNDSDDTSDKDNYSVDLNFTGQCPVTGTKLFTRYFFGKDENSWFNGTTSNPDGWDMGDTSENNTDQQGAQFQLSNSFSFLTLTGGFDWLKYDVENSWTPKKTEYSNPALFLLTKASFLEDRMTVDLGLRYDWYDVKVEEPAGRDEDQTHFTPQLGLAWLLMDELKVRARFAEGFMMPSADQLAADYNSFGSHIVGNPDLDPETSKTYEAGLDFIKNGLASSLTYFYTDFEDKISTKYLSDGSQSWENIGDATISGIEAELSYDLGSPLDLSWEIRPFLTMTLLTTYEDDTTNEDLKYVSGTNFSSGLVLNNYTGITCRLNVAYSGSQDVDDWESGLYPTPVTSLDSNVVTDLSASWRFFESETAGAITVRGEIRNLFDEDYAYVKGYPMPGRSFFAGLRWDY